MDVPVEISFTNLNSSPALEQRIRERVAKLDKISGHLVSCRVAVALPHRQHQQGNIPRIRIDMAVPGQELVVSHEPHHMERKYTEPDIINALNEAFRAAERKLIESKERLAASSRQPRPSTV